MIAKNKKTFLNINYFYIVGPSGVNCAAFYRLKTRHKLYNYSKNVFCWLLKNLSVNQVIVKTCCI